MKTKDRQATIAASELAAALRAPQPRGLDTSRPEPPARSNGALYRFEVWFRCSDRASVAATARRRAVPIHGYVGPNGGGKSLAMVKDTLPSLDRGRRVLSTVRLLDSATGEPHPLYEPFTDWDQLVAARDCDVLMDEIVGVAGSREAMRMPPSVQNVLVQLRRRNVLLRWSAPNWRRADTIIREVTQAVTMCTGRHPDRRGLVRQGDAHEQAELQLWAPKRLFRFRTFDTVDFDEWTAAKASKVPVSASEWFRGPGSRAFASYDTLDAVEMVGMVDADTGRCTSCNGVRRPKPCTCDRGDLRSGRRPQPVELVGLRTAVDDAPREQQQVELV